MKDVEMDCSASVAKADGDGCEFDFLLIHPWQMIRGNSTSFIARYCPSDDETEFNSFVNQITSLRCDPTRYQSHPIDTPRLTRVLPRRRRLLTDHSFILVICHPIVVLSIH